VRHSDKVIGVDRTFDCKVLAVAILPELIGRILPKILTRNSSGDEIANVNFLTDDIIHVLQNTIDSYVNSATDQRRYVLERRFT